MLRHTYRWGLDSAQALARRVRSLLKNRKVRRVFRTLVSAAVGPLIGSLITRGCVSLPEPLRPACQVVGQVVSKVLGSLL